MTPSGLSGHPNGLLAEVGGDPATRPMSIRHLVQGERAAEVEHLGAVDLCLLKQRGVAELLRGHVLPVREQAAELRHHAVVDLHNLLLALGVCRRCVAGIQDARKRSYAGESPRRRSPWVSPRRKSTASGMLGTNERYPPASWAN